MSVKIDELLDKFDGKSKKYGGGDLEVLISTQYRVIQNKNKSPLFPNINHLLI